MTPKRWTWRISCMCSKLASSLRYDSARAEWSAKCPSTVCFGSPDDRENCRQVHVPRLRSLPHHVRIEPNAAPLPFLIDPLHFVVEAGVPVKRLLECEEIVQHRLRALVPALARHHYADARRVNERKGGRDPAADFVERHVVDFVRDERLVGALGRHRELGKARGTEAEPLELLDVPVAVEPVHLVADTAQRVASVAIGV